MDCPQCAEVIWKLECTEKELEDLKKQRHDDAKANEKVASIYATQEQAWFGERNRQRLQIAALLNQLGIFEKRRAECVENLTEKVKELEDSLASNKRMLEEEQNRRKELDEELKMLEKSAAVQAETNAAEALKNKTAFVQLVSSHRQLEAELSRSFRHVEDGKYELSLILEQKDEALSMAQKLSLEVVKLRSEAEEKYEARSQKHSITSMWYKHRNSGSKSSQTQAKTSENENADEKKYRRSLEHTHQLELHSLAEQLRLRDEKIEILHWRLVSTEIKSEQLRAHVEGLNQDTTQLTKMNMKLKEQLLDYEADLHHLKNRLASNPSSKNSNNEGKSDNDTDQFPSEVWMDVKEVITEQRTLKKTSSCGWKIDVQSLGVFHKVKMLKQQLILLESLATHVNSIKEKDFIGDNHAFAPLVSLLNKQVCGYESLQARIDELCNRMNEESHLNGKKTQSTLKRKTKEEIKVLERYLQEALQLQRYMVASGQKLTEIHAGISGAFSAVADKVETMSSMDMSRFGCSIRDLLKEIQKGLEIQSSRIIGDLEGILACDGIINHVL